jgi:hypothetical protein
MPSSERSLKPIWLIAGEIKKKEKRLIMKNFNFIFFNHEGMLRFSCFLQDQQYYPSTVLMQKNSTVAQIARATELHKSAKFRGL